MKTPLCPRLLEAAVLGGSVLGGGGGGASEWGLHYGRLALAQGRPVLLDGADLPPESTVVTVSLVGAPASPDAHVDPDHLVRAVELLSQQARRRPDALITNENGGFATVNGWVQAARLGIPILDSPCNGRAHPTGLMGAMGLHHRPGYDSWQACAGGDPGQDRYLEATVRASLRSACALVRQAAVAAGGLVAVARNPVPVEYALAHGAPGAIRQAMELGRAMLEAGPGDTAAVAARDFLQGELTGRGLVREVSLASKGGFDSGRVLVEEPSGRQHLLTFWNEYVLAETPGRVSATFPDLICTLSATTGRPISTAEIGVGMEVMILLVDRQRLILSPTMYDAELLGEVERAIAALR